MISVTNELVEQVKIKLLEKLVPTIILESEKAISGYKYELDVTDVTDNNNLKLARDVAENVYNLLPKILSEVGDEIEKELGEN